MLYCHWYFIPKQNVQISLSLFPHVHTLRENRTPCTHAHTYTYQPSRASSHLHCSKCMLSEQRQPRKLEFFLLQSSPLTIFSFHNYLQTLHFLYQQICDVYITIQTQTKKESYNSVKKRHPLCPDRSCFQATQRWLSSRCSPRHCHQF